MPLSRIDAASSWSCSGRMEVRGWKGFGSRLSTATSAADSAPDGSGSGSSADSPFPSAFLFMGDQFLGQIQVRLGAPGPYVVEQYGFTKAGRFAESDATRHRGPKHEVLEMAADLRDHLLAQVR